MSINVVLLLRHQKVWQKMQKNEGGINMKYGASKNTVSPSLKRFDSAPLPFE